MNRKMSQQEFLAWLVGYIDAKPDAGVYHDIRRRLTETEDVITPKKWGKNEGS